MEYSIMLFEAWGWEGGGGVVIEKIYRECVFV